MSSYGPAAAAADVLDAATAGSYRVCETVVLVCLACASGLIVLTVAICFRRAFANGYAAGAAAGANAASGSGRIRCGFRRPRSRRFPSSRTGGAAPAPGGRSARSASPWCGTERRCGCCRCAGTCSTWSASTCGCGPTPRACSAGATSASRPPRKSELAAGLWLNLFPSMTSKSQLLYMVGSWS
ncbi:unnamed protein product [Urochloa humidicola]